MNRRVISAFLLIVMLISLFPVQAFATEDDPAVLSEVENPETVKTAEAAPSDDGVPGEEVDVLPMPDAEYEESTEEEPTVEEPTVEEPTEETNVEPTENSETPDEAKDEAEDETVDTEEPAEKVSVRFNLAPADLTLKVYPADDADSAEAQEPAAEETQSDVSVSQAISPEDDGSYLLVPGEYCYDAEREGYVSALDVAFTVTESVAIDVTLEEDSMVSVMSTDSSEYPITGKCGENITWSLDENGVLTINGTGDMYDYDYDTDKGYISVNTPWNSIRGNIKKIIIDSGVTSIGNSAFDCCGSATSVQIPNTVKKIGARAFVGTCITEFDIPESVTSIGGSAFLGSSIQSIHIRGSVATIEPYTFNKCNGLKSVILSEGTKKICSNAFAICGSSLSVTIPDTVTFIGSGAFGEASLKDVYYTGTLKQWKTIKIENKDEFGDAAIYTAHTVTYNANGGKSAPKAQKKLYGEELVLSDAVPTRDNYVFLGWSTGKTDTAPAYKRGDSYTGEEDVTLYAVWRRANDKCGKNVMWTLDENGALTISGTGDMEYIGEWSTYREDIKEVIIEDGVTSIYASAFECFTSLESVTIADSVAIIGDGAFFECSALESAELPANLSGIGVQLFANCYNLCSVTIPTGVASIGDGAFYMCQSLESITIPATVISIGDKAFAGCSSLAGMVIPGSVQRIGDSAFAYCASLTGALINSGVSSIGDYAFYSCSALNTLTIADSVCYLGEGAFAECSSLISVRIPGNAYQINGYAFSGCDNLATVEICEGVLEIPAYAFSNCQELTNVILPDSIGCINDYAFLNCVKLANITIPENVLSIGNGAFSNCSSISDITIPVGVTTIAWYAFADCASLASVTIPEDVIYISGYAFNNCAALKDVYYSGSPLLWSKVNIQNGNSALKDANIHYGRDGESGTCGEKITWSFDADTGALTISGTGDMDNYTYIGINYLSSAPWHMYDTVSVVIQEGVTGIGDYAFYNCHNLQSISISATVERIGKNALDCPTVSYLNKGMTELGMVSSLQKIDVSEDNPVFSSSDGVLFSKSGDVLIKYPGGREGSYAIPTGVREIAEYAFHGSTKLTSVTMEDNVGKIGADAFNRCVSLKKIRLSESLASIEKFTFYNCENLSELTIPSNVTSIGNYAFGSCIGLSEVIISDNVTSIGYGAFQFCEGMTSVTIPISVKAIENWAFYNCTTLKDVYYLGAKTQWDDVEIGDDNESLLNATLHAGFLVVYDANGGEGAPDEQIKEKGKTLKLSAVIPTREYYTFLGWAASKTATSAQYKAGASYTKNADITLYAVWKPILITKITVTPASSTLYGANQKFKLEYSVEPATADDAVTWKSSNEKIAVVDENGVVTTTGTAYGTVTITATAKDSGKKIGKCTLTVKSPLIEALTVIDNDENKYNDRTITLPFISGKTYQYTADITPSDSASKIKWTSSNTKVASVNASGLLTVKGAGTAVITATSSDTNGASASFTVNVVNYTPTLSAKSVKINSFFNSGEDISVTCAANSTLVSLELCTKNRTGYTALENIEVEGDEGVYCLKANGVTKGSYNAYAKVTVSCEGIEDNVDYYLPLKISVVYTAPTVKVTCKRVNTFYPELDWAITSTVKGGSVEGCKLGEGSNEYFELSDDGNLRLSDKGKAAVEENPKASIARTPVKLVYSFVDSDNTVTVSYKPTVTYTEPTVKIGVEKINPFYVDRAWNVTVTVTNGELKDDSSYELKNGDNGVLELNGNKKLVLTDDAIETLRKNSKAKLNSGALEFIVHFKDTVNTKTVSVKPSIAVSTPKFTARDVSTGKTLSYVTFNHFFNTNTAKFELYDNSSKSVVTIPHDCTISDSTGVFDADYDSSNITVTCNDYGAMKSKATFEFNSDEWLSSVKLAVNVKYAAAPKMTFSASGKIDLIDRENTGITYTPRITNGAGSSVTAMWLDAVTAYNKEDATDAFNFSYDPDTGKATLRANDGYALLKKAYTVKISATLELNGETCDVSATVKVTPTQSTLKLKASAVKIKQGETLYVDVITTPAACELESSTVTVPAKASGLKAEFDEDAKCITITADSELKPGTYTITVAALPKNAASGTAAAKLSIRVTVIKSNAYVQQIYAPILEKYSYFINNTDRSLKSASELEISIAAHYGDKIGYAFYDLDNSGYPELIIAPISTSWITSIYDAYSIVDGAPKWLFTGTERTQYYLLSNRKIMCSGASGAGIHSFEYLKYMSSELHFIEGYNCVDENVFHHTKVASSYSFNDGTRLTGNFGNYDKSDFTITDQKGYAMRNKDISRSFLPALTEIT